MKKNFTKRIIGIDPGTAILGFGVVDSDGYTCTLVDAGVVRTKPHQPLDERLVEIYEALNEILADNKPTVMVIEKLFFAQNVTTAMSVSHARGVAMLAGKQAGCEIVEYTPLQIKQQLTGYGKATKKQMQEMVKIHLKLSEVPQPDDCADALAAAIIHSTVARRF